MFEGFLGKVISRLREQAHRDQSKLADEVGVTREHLGHVENGNVPDPDLLLNLYATLIPEAEQKPEALTALLVDWFAVIFDREVQKARNRKEHKPAQEAMLQQAHEAIRKLVKQHEGQLNPPGKLRSLENFPGGFLPLTIITGDRRHTAEPRGPGDVFVKSAATTDLMFLPELGLPKGRRITFDRIFALMEEEQLREELGQTNLLVTGSGLVNLATRVLNEHCLFRFRVRTEAKRVNEEVRKLSFRLSFQNHLNSFRAFWHLAGVLQQFDLSLHQDDKVPIQELQQRVREIFGGTVPEQYIQDFAGSAFIAPAGEKVRFPSSLYHNRAVVSLGRNPYDQSGRFVTILAAGTGALGTAHAVRALARQPFDRHPFGGILDVELGSSPEPKNFEEATCKWVDSDGYTPESLLKKVKSALDVSSTGDQSQSLLKPDELSECRNFIETLKGVNNSPV